MVLRFFIILSRSVSFSILSLALSYKVYSYFLFLKQQSQILPKWKNWVMKRQNLSLLLMYIFRCLFNSFLISSGNYSLNSSYSSSLPLSQNKLESFVLAKNILFEAEIMNWNSARGSKQKPKPSMTTSVMPPTSPNKSIKS